MPKRIPPLALVHNLRNKLRSADGLPDTGALVTACKVAKEKSQALNALDEADRWHLKSGFDEAFREFQEANGHFERLAQEHGPKWAARFAEIARAAEELVRVATQHGVEPTVFVSAGRYYRRLAGAAPTGEEVSPPPVNGSRLGDVLEARLIELEEAIEGKQGGGRKSDGGAMVVALTPDEQALLDVLNEEGQTGPDLVAILTRQKMGTWDESKISRMAGRPPMKARGVRHRKGAGYYLQENRKTTAK